MGCDVSGQVYIPATVKFYFWDNFLCILNILSSVCGTLANGLVITEYYRNSRLRTIQNTIFFLLAITDISVTALVQPTYVAAVLHEVLGEQHCLLWDIASLSKMIFVYMSLATMVILGVQSYYLTLAYPYHCQNIVTMRRLKITVICSWICIVAATFAVKFNSPLQTYLTVLIISSTISIVVFTWIWTCRLVARHRKAIEATQTPSAREIVSKKKILRSTVTALAVILSLLCCYLFGLCFVFFKLLLNAWKIDGDTNSILAAAIATLMYLNSLLNPCLVFWRNSSFREEIKKIKKK